MIEQNHTTTSSDYDDLMASLFVLITHHSLTQCNSILPTIVDRLQQLCHHTDIEHYPNQMRVLIKMQQLWKTRLFESQLTDYEH